jgi:signal transduction histidine kinase
VRKERLATLGQLTATVSHELRNPLGAMRPSLYVIEKGINTNDERILRALARLDRNITRCDRIIDELLDFTRAGRLSTSRFELDKWLEELIREQSIPAFIAVKQDLNLPGKSVVADENRLRRAIINIIENAWHAMSEDNAHLREDEDPELVIRTSQSSGRYEITIADSGPGIHKEILPRIFEPLFSTKNFGVGLGLPTVRHILEQHGGGIVLESEHLRGTRATLWLPTNAKARADQSDTGSTNTTPVVRSSHG